jgi:hypothetical protein
MLASRRRIAHDTAHRYRSRRSVPTVPDDTAATKDDTLILFLVGAKKGRLTIVAGCYEFPWGVCPTLGGTLPEGTHSTYY